ncbi:hypothetical protein [Stenomitos frigidus]|uniref:Uncharacterized protein n=1 Tax=Stenomitos frigidus ULC18 TaxID=2107698 RepID=A0A2T1DXG7_9CYAN|nr:hypothetical protein [Stenomitos frigidus]PSB25198.1 hypothetical protein C7B82_24215 [Stenomitos frigidus ULC18]
MDELIREPLNLVVLLIAILIAIPLFGWLLTLVQATFRAALSLAAIGIIAALILIVLFGVSPDQIVHQVSRTPQALRQILIEGTNSWKSFSQAYGK